MPLPPPLPSNIADRHHAVRSIVPEYLYKALPYRSLNKMQIECLDTWQSDVNMLISAPTGAGKTVCFELAILRILHQTMRTSQKKRLTTKNLLGKIVYIAPTKSLCSERAQDWQRKFEYLGLRVQAITGDMTSSSFDTALRRTDLIVTTAEKWDSVTRNLGSKTPIELSTQIRLLLLDEVHHVGDSRGAVFESVVTRMLVARDTSSSQLSFGGTVLPAASLRVIAVSATVSNVADIGRWIRVTDTNIKVFDDTYRPVALEYYVFGYTARNPWLYGKVYDNHVLEIIKEYGEGKPCIVFCTSRRQTVVSAQTLLGKLKNKESSPQEDGNPFLRSLSQEQISHLTSSAKQCNHTLLSCLLPYGIAIHNADMNTWTRNLVETMFRDSLIGCLFSTSTLAQGVNLPARLVIIAGTTVYTDSGLKEYQCNLLRQMCGRAGRPGLDSKGVVVVMTALPNVGKYKKIGKNSSNVVLSQLSGSIAETVNVEVARQVITDVPSAITFLSSTLFSKQLHPSSIEEDHTCNPNGEKRLHSAAMKAINMLCDRNLVQYDADHFGLSCTLPGILMAKYCLSVNTMHLLMTKVPMAVSTSQVLRIVASCPEVQQGVSLRRSEKKRLNVMNEWIRMPVKGKVQETTDKIVILLQIVIGDQKSSSSDVALRSEGQRVLQLAARVAACVIAMVLRGAICVPYETALVVLHVCRGLQNRCLWDGPTVLRQVPGITVSGMRALSKAGIMSLPKLAEMNPEMLDGELGCRSDFAATIDRRLRAFPRFVVKTEVLPEKGIQEEDLSLSVSVDVMSMRGSGKLRQHRGASCFILIGASSVYPMARHVFPLSDGHGSTRCPLPRKVSQAPNGWIDVVVGCDNLCGTDVIKKIRSGQQSQVTQPQSAHSQCASTVSRQAKQRLSVTEGRVTKKLSQTKLSPKEKALPSSSLAQMPIPLEPDKISPMTSFPESYSPVSAKNPFEKCHSLEHMSASAMAETTVLASTQGAVTTETRDVPAPKKEVAKLDVSCKPKQTPAPSESHIALPPFSPIHENGKEYDDVFRALF